MTNRSSSGNRYKRQLRKERERERHLHGPTLPLSVTSAGEYLVHEWDFWVIDGVILGTNDLNRNNFVNLRRTSSSTLKDCLISHFPTQADITQQLVIRTIHTTPNQPDEECSPISPNNHLADDIYSKPCPPQTEPHHIIKNLSTEWSEQCDSS